MLRSFLTRHRYSLSVLAGLAIVNLVFFAGNLRNFFVSDDFDWIELTRSASGIFKVLTGNYYGIHGAGGSFRPMVNLIFAHENFLFGLNPAGYHLVSIFFHIGAAFMVYLIAARLFVKSANSNFIAALAAFIFSILPNHTEAVVWIAAVADPVTTFLYLLSFYLYLRSKKIAAFIFFGLAILTKETAITLPFLILGYELIINRNFNLKKLAKIFYPYFLILAVYLVWRFWAIGLLFGYYGRTSLAATAHLKEYARMLINLDVNSLLYGTWRIAVAGWLFHYWFVYAALFAGAIYWLILEFKAKRNSILVFLAYFWLLNVALVLPLSLGLHNDEGSRYGYLPSVAVAMTLGWLVIKIWEKKKELGFAAGSLLIFYFLLNLNIQTGNWSRASDVSKKIYHQLSQFDYQAPVKTYFLGMPDNYLGAQVMRNGVAQALQLQNISGSDKVERIPIYSVLDKNNFDGKIFDGYDGYPDGYLFHALDDKFNFTGNATETHEGYKFELWGYDYAQALSAHIRLMFIGDGLKDFQEGRTQILYYDEGKLKKL